MPILRAHYSYIAYSNFVIEILNASKVGYNRRKAARLIAPNLCTALPLPPVSSFRVNDIEVDVTVVVVIQNLVGTTWALRVLVRVVVGVVTYPYAIVLQHIVHERVFLWAVTLVGIFHED